MNVRSLRSLFSLVPFCADIDTNWIENPLAVSILQNEKLRSLIDCFYFEHHVFLSELAKNWGKSMEGSVSDSLKIFSEMRYEILPLNLIYPLYSLSPMRNFLSLHSIFNNQRARDSIALLALTF